MENISLGKVCDLFTGGTPSKQKSEYFNNGKIKWLVSGDINQREIFECEGRITQEGMNNSNAKFLPLDSVLIALNGQGKTRGTVAMLRTNATCNQSLVAISPKDKAKFNTKFIFYVLDGMYREIRKLTGDSGNDRRGLNMRIIRDIEIPLLPLEQQQCIVAKLDKGFEKIQNIKTQITEKSKLIIAIKESIISQYTKNDNNKTNLLWKRSPLSDLCKKYKDDIVDGPFGSNLKTKDFKDEGVPVLKIQHVKQFEINYLNPTYISNQKYNELIRHSFKKGDIVLTKLGKPLGAASIVQEINEGIIVADLVRIRIDPQKIDNEFLCFQLNSLHIRAEINSFTRGATRPRIKLDVIRTLKINYPLIQEQKNISKKLNKLLKEVSNLIKTNEEIGNQLELLKLSILRNLLIKK